MMIVAAFLGLSIIVVVTAMPHSNDIDDLRFDSVESALGLNLRNTSTSPDHLIGRYL